MSRIAVACLAFWIALQPVAPACSFFMCARNGVVLAGNNEDYLDPDTRMWFVPSEDGRLGCVYFGFSNGFPQGGMNEAGLFFDGAATPEQEITGRPDRPSFEGNLVDEMMRTCRTVEEVVATWERYDVPKMMARAQIQFADATGDSVLIEGDHLLRKEGDYQITTNFYQAGLERDQFACPRFEVIDSMLEGDAAPSVELFRKILSRVHQEGEVSTLYSNIYDLKRRKMTLYHFHDFEHPVEIDLAAELGKGAHTVVIADLFPETFAFEQFQKRHRAKRAK
ncbi:MAG: hypothetical protein RL885_31235 [Planctomycetota bacterium]